MINRVVRAIVLCNSYRAIEMTLVLTRRLRIGSSSFGFSDPHIARTDGENGYLEEVSESSMEAVQRLK